MASDKFRLRSIEMENATHIINVCGMLAQKENKQCHDKLISHLHCWLCKKSNRNDTTTNQRRWSKRTKSRDLNIQTNRNLEAINPYINVVEKISRSMKLTNLKCRLTSGLSLPECETFRPLLSLLSLGLSSLYHWTYIKKIWINPSIPLL